MKNFYFYYLSFSDKYIRLEWHYPHFHKYQLFFKKKLEKLLIKPPQEVVDKLIKTLTTTTN